MKKSTIINNQYEQDIKRWRREALLFRLGVSVAALWVVYGAVKMLVGE